MDRALIKSYVQYRLMQSQIQSLNIKRPAEPSSRVIVSTILINCPAVAVAATTIPSGYFIPTVSTNCSISTAIDLCRYQAYFTAGSAGSIMPFNYSDRSILLFRLFYRYRSTDCHRLTATDCLPLPRFLLPKVLLPDVLLLTITEFFYRVLLPLTVLFYFTAPNVCFYYYFYYHYCYYCYCYYCCYCYRYYFQFTAVLVTTGRKIGPKLQIMEG